MRKRIQYLFFVLLCVTAAALCRQQSVAQAAQSHVRVGSVLAQDMQTPRSEASRLLIHTFLAPEAASDTSFSLDHKAPAKSILHNFYGTGTRRAIAAAPRTKNAVRHPVPKQYYIFSLGKIRI